MSDRRSSKRFARFFAMSALLVLPATGSAFGEGPAAWKVVEPGFDWDFPRDHWAMPEYRVEWWYFTGFLDEAADAGPHDPSGRADSPGALPRYGFQFTFFRIGLARDSLATSSRWRSRNLIMGHAALIDLDRGEHRFSEAIHRDAPLLASIGTYPDSALVSARAPAGTDGVWTLAWNGAGFDFAMHDDRRRIAFALETRAAKPLVLQGPDGYSVKGPSNASLYYSFPRLETKGTITWNGREVPVAGRAWMDRELSSGHLGAGQVGWDWFSLRMNDGRDLMLYALRDSTGATRHRAGTVIDADGAPSYLGDGWSAVVRETWESPATGIEYPVAWDVAVPERGLDCRVDALFPEQENRTTIPGGIDYWEGAVRVTDGNGNELGIGFVEMTGYGDGNRPPL